MISVQLPNLPIHSFDPFSDYYVMADPAPPLPASTTAAPIVPTLQTSASEETFSSCSEGPPKAQPGAKRRPSRAGTRSVSTLTAAQLERKRANDREAQRAIRQRTKEHIENLERRIQELTATNETGAKLMAALKRNEELEQENAMLRSRLNHAVAAMSDNGVTPAEGMALATGPPSPGMRMKLNAIRASPVPSVVHGGVPVSAVQSAGTTQDAWANPFNPISAPPPPMSDVSSVESSIRWSTPHTQVTTPVTEADRMLQPVDTTVQQPVSYGFMVDSTGRPMHYPEQTQLVSYPQPSASPVHMSEYHPRQPNAPMATNPTYTPYQSHQTYIGTTIHEEPVAMMQPAPMHPQQHMAYNMSTNMKTD